MRPPRLPAVSLFTNCGAGDVGYARAGFRFQALGELRRTRLDVASLNHPEASVVPGDLRDTWPEVVRAYRDRMGGVRPALLAACPPCQGMSTAQSRRGQGADADAGSRDTRNLLVEVIANVARELQPRCIVVENVVAFLTKKVRHPDDGQSISAARLLIDRLQTDYHPFAMRSDLADFGVPQTRRRAFLVLLRNDEPSLARLLAAERVPFPAPTSDPSQRISLADALAQLDAGPLDGATVEVAGTGMHSVPVWSAARYAMVAAIPPHSGRSAWQNDDCPRCGTLDIAADAATCPRCFGPLARPVVREAESWRLINGFRNSSYRRMSPDRPAATITTASGRIGSDNTLHPFENRVLSPLECQHLQTIPPTFDWGDHLESHGHTSLREMIGEAVPPQFTQEHGRVLVAALEGRTPRRSMVASDVRTTGAMNRLGLL